MEVDNFFRHCQKFDGSPATDIEMVKLLKVSVCYVCVFTVPRYKSQTREPDTETPKYRMRVKRNRVECRLILSRRMLLHARHILRAQNVSAGYSHRLIIFLIYRYS